MPFSIAQSGSAAIVNSYDDEDTNPSAVPLAGGGYVVVWQRYVLGHTSVQQQVFNPFGAPLGKPSGVDTITVFNPEPDVAPLPAGGYAVVWKAEDKVVQRSFGPTGSPVGAGVAIADEETYQVNAATLANGNLAVVSQRNTQIQHQMRDASANPLPVPQGLVSVKVTGQGEPDVAALAGGGYVVAWEDGHETADSAITYRLADAAGAWLGSPLEVAPGSKVEIAGLRDGGFVLAWIGSAVGDTVFQQRYNAAGVPLGAATPIDGVPAESYRVHTVEALPDGGWVLAWSSRSGGTLHRRYNSSGNSLNGAERVTDTQVQDPDIVPLRQGGYAIVWETAYDGDIYQRIFGQTTAGADTVLGTAGTDTLDLTPGIVGPGDRIDGLRGKDTLRLSGGSFDFSRVALTSIELILGSAGNDVLVGSVGGDFVRAGYGHDRIMGHVGNDSLFGGAGNDRLAGNSGNDTLTADSGHDTLTGDAGNDKLFGGAGNDRLSGGLGGDKLIGNAGRDIFVFDTKAAKANVDQVVSFSVRDDTIYLDNAVFKKLGKGAPVKPGKLKEAYLEVGSKAADGNDFLIYNPKTGSLFYDLDGSRSTAPIAIATLSKNLKLTAADFFVI